MLHPARAAAAVWIFMDCYEWLGGDDATGDRCKGHCSNSNQNGSPREATCIVSHAVLLVWAPPLLARTQRSLITIWCAKPPVPPRFWSGDGLRNKMVRRGAF